MFSRSGFVEYIPLGRGTGSSELLKFDLVTGVREN
jgi:hypothetical protein